MYTMRYKVKDADLESENSGTTDSKLEKRENPLKCSTIWIVGLGLCLIGLSSYTILLVLANYQGAKICLSEDCVQTASRMLSAMNRTVEPCTDFYEFACGSWIHDNPVPEWSTTWDQLARLRERLVEDLRDLLEEPEQTGFELPKSVLKAKALYRTCMDTERLERVGIAPIVATLQMLGLPATPPVAGENEDFVWEQVAGKARRFLGLSALVGIHVTEDVRNTSLNRIVMEQVSPGFSERYLMQPEKFKNELHQYKTYITAMINAFDVNSDGDKFATDIIEFSQALAQIMTPSEVRRSGNHLFHEVSITQLISGATNGPQEWKDFNWNDYLENVFDNTSVVLDADDDRVILMDLPYLQKLSVLLNKTEPVIVEKFIWWSVLSTVAPLTLSQFRTLGFAFSREVFGLQRKTPRWKGCTANVNANFGLALSYLYVKHHFDQDSREKANEMVEDVRAAFAAVAKTLDWMDNTTRERTLLKLKAIRNYVGFPMWLFNTTELDGHYNESMIVDGKLFETYLSLTQATVKKNLESIREKPDRDRWVATATTVNAFYSATLNSVTFPAGILQPPFYGNGIEAINYGSIGAIMGHEVTHGFDDQGRRYDENGNLKHWWSAATLEHYHNKVQCIIDQYSKYHMAQLPNYTVHGFNTQGENIADNGGLRAALNAYSLYTQRNTQVKRERLPGLGYYNPKQLFFLGFAQIWCGNSTVGALKSKLVEGVHSPNKIRVIGTLSNSVEFSEAWSCPKGSPMNPEHKCVLW